MQKLTLTLALAALICSVAALLKSNAPPPAVAASRDAWKEERQYPPLVFTGKAWLDCSISSTENGRQTMNTVSGQGFTFDAPMKPIRDGKVQVKTPGMKYSFTSFPTGPVPARFGGIGDGVITAMKTEVEVDVSRFEQPGGPGTNIRFRSSDIRGDSAYVEFTGLFVRTRDRKRFPFRVLFGSVPTGEGSVTPAGPKPEERLMEKRVSLGTESNTATMTTALYEAEDDVAALK
jgi:hypothetical protein